MGRVRSAGTCGQPNEVSTPFSAPRESRSLARAKNTLHDSANASAALRGWARRACWHPMRRPPAITQPGHSRRVAGVMAPLSSDAISAGSFINERGSTARDISSVSCASSTRPVVTSMTRQAMRRGGVDGCAWVREALVASPRPPRTTMAIAAARPAERRRVTRSDRGSGECPPTSNRGSPAADDRRPPYSR